MINPVVLVFQIPTTKKTSTSFEKFVTISSDFVTSVRPVSLTHKNPQGRKIIHGKRMIHRFENSLVEYIGCLISVAVVERCIFFVLLTYRRTIFKFQYTVM